MLLDFTARRINPKWPPPCRRDGRTHRRQSSRLAYCVSLEWTSAVRRWFKWTFHKYVTCVSLCVCVYVFLVASFLQKWTDKNLSARIRFSRLVGTMWSNVYLHTHTSQNVGHDVTALFIAVVEGILSTTTMDGLVVATKRWSCFWRFWLALFCWFAPKEFLCVSISLSCVCECVHARKPKKSCVWMCVCVRRIA
jgi:hypothetical protein